MFDDVVLISIYCYFEKSFFFMNALTRVEGVEGQSEGSEAGASFITLVTLQLLQYITTKQI